MADCPDRGIECKLTCIGPVGLKVETVGSIEGNSRMVVYDVATTITSVVCSLDLDDRIEPTDWVYDTADVLGRVFDNTPARSLPTRILTITEAKG
jgi:hypothetical protein